MKGDFMNIKVENISKTIKGVKVLDGINLEFNSGEITGLKGINGSGKTMLMRTICGLIRPTTGKVIIDGKELKKDMDFPESIGILIDSPPFSRTTRHSIISNILLQSKIK